MDVGKIRKLVVEGRYVYSKHAERERESKSPISGLKITEIGGNLYVQDLS